MFSKVKMLGIGNGSKWYTVVVFAGMLSSLSFRFHCAFSQVKLQESPEDMPAGQTPHTVILFAHNDLVDKVQPGDRVNVTGKDVGCIDGISLSCF